MRKTLLIIAIIFLSSSWAFADSVTLKWDPSTGATSYKLYTSLDQGITWSAGVDVGNVTQYIMTNVPGNVFVMFKVSALNGVAESVTHWMGAWYDGRRRPPDYAAGLGAR